MACTSSDVDALTGKLLLIGNGTDDDYTTPAVTARILKIVQSKVFPAFCKAGYTVPWDYPSTEFSKKPPAATDDIATAENGMITEMIAKGVACDLCMNLPRYSATSEVMGYVMYSEHKTVKGWCTEFSDWLTQVENGEIPFEGITQGSTPSRTVLYPDTTPLWDKFDDGDGTESDQDDW